MKPINRILVVSFYIGLVVVACYAVFVPMKITRENSISVTGTVIRVYGDRLKDVVVIIDGYNGRLLINSGVTRGFDTDSLRKRLVGKKAAVLYLKPYWLSAFTPAMGNTRYITEIRESNEVVFSELK